MWWCHVVVEPHLVVNIGELLLPIALSREPPVDLTRARSSGWPLGTRGAATAAWGPEGSPEGTGEVWPSRVFVQEESET